MRIEFLSMKEYDEKYWNDYSLFIQRVEEITRQSPSNLLEHYISLVEELEQMPGGDGIEWVYEEFLDENVRQLIQKALDDNKVANNILLLEFSKQVSEIDLRMQEFLIPDVKQNLDWRKDFKIAFIDWNRLGLGNNKVT